LFGRYREAFADIDGLALVAEPEDCRSNYWLQALLLDKGCEAQRDPILAATNAVGCMTRPAWILMHELPQFADCPRMPLATASSLAARLINIPSGPGLLAGR
jgi:perosamine synthetase